MSAEDIKKLLGGYATGTLTADEQQALFAAALQDQELFDALAREQSLRDLLRDPAARAELLSALDTPASRPGGFWQWLRRPMVAGLAVAAVAEIALVGVAVWRGTRARNVRPAAPAIVAELKRPDAAPAVPTAPAAPPAKPAEGRPQTKLADAPVAAMAEKKAAHVMALPSAAPPAAGARAQVAEAPAALMKDKAIVSTMAPPPPPAPAAMGALMARKAEGDATATGQAVGTISGAVHKEGTLDVRALFYDANQLPPPANAFVQPDGGGGGAAPLARPLAPRRDAPQTATSAAALAAPLSTAAPRLGVRVSILRGASEVDLATALDPGETVRLKVTPNADGFLYVVEGSRTVASGAAQRLRPFETPELRFEGSGQRQLYVMLSRRPQTAEPQSFGSLAGDNLTGTSAGATYVVSGRPDAGAQQVVVPVTLTYR
jgi:hypothetical protein